MKSEFSKYANLKTIRIQGGHFCLDNGRYVRDQSLKETINHLDDLLDSSEELACRSISHGDIEGLSNIERQSNNLDSLIARMDLQILARNYKDQ